jgi:hypothetical protein
MESAMHIWRTTLGVTLVVLLLAFSFNAYACLLPIYGGATTADGSACSTTDEQSARQFCDAYKTLRIPAASDFSLPTDDEAPLFNAAVPFELLFHLQAGNLISRSAVAIPPSNLHVKSSVLRL